MTQEGSADSAANATSSATGSPSITDAYPDYEQVGPAWIAPPTKNHMVSDIFIGKRYALLFGWLDGQFKYVEKYAQWYRANGYTAIVQLSADRDWSFVWNGKDEFDEFDSLIAYLQEHKITEPAGSKVQSTNPNVIIHSFSNGGVTKLKRNINALHAKGLQLKSQVVIVDSAPGKASPQSLGGYMASLSSNYFLQKILYAGAYSFLVVAEFIGYYDRNLHPVSRSAPYALSTGNTDGNAFGARLFLYSEADAVVPFVEIKDNIELAKANGLIVEEMMFTTSAHVKHAVDFKEEYWATVEAFLKKHVK